jgi:hypothetical protein
MLATPGRLELPAYGLGNRRSILLSYGVATNDQYRIRFPRRNRDVADLARSPRLGLLFDPGKPDKSRFRIEASQLPPCSGTLV